MRTRQVCTSMCSLQSVNLRPETGLGCYAAPIKETPGTNVAPANRIAGAFFLQIGQIPFLPPWWSTTLIIFEGKGVRRSDDGGLIWQVVLGSVGVSNIVRVASVF